MGQCCAKAEYIGTDAIAETYLPHHPRKAAKLMEREGDALSASLVWLAMANLTEAKKVYRHGNAKDKDYLWYSPTVQSNNHPYWELFMACEAQDRRAIEIRAAALDNSYGMPSWKRELLFNIKETTPWAFY